jgi:hypothetical protein
MKKKTSLADFISSSVSRQHYQQVIKIHTYTHRIHNRYVVRSSKLGCPLCQSQPQHREMDDLQRVPAASNNHARTFIPSSKQSDQHKSRSFGIQNLLNAVEGENHLNESSIFGSPSLSELNTCLLVPSPPAARSSSYHQVNQEASYSQVENREHQLTVNPKPPQPSSQRDGPSM